MNVPFGCPCDDRGAFPGLSGNRYGFPGAYWQESGPYGPYATMDGHGTEPPQVGSPPPTMVSVPNPGYLPTVVPGFIKPPGSVIEQGTAPTGTIMQGTARPPSSTIQSAPGKVMALAGITAPVLGQRGYTQGYAAPYAGYAGLFDRDAAAQCAKFRGKLQEAKLRGQQGLFGNKQDLLRADVSRWCGKAVGEEHAYAIADKLYADAMAAGDVATASVIDAAVDQQLAADRQTGYYAAGAVGLAALGLAFLMLGGGR